MLTPLTAKPASEKFSLHLNTIRGLGFLALREFPHRPNGRRAITAQTARDSGVKSPGYLHLSRRGQDVVKLGACSDVGWDLRKLQDLGSSLTCPDPCRASAFHQEGGLHSPRGCGSIETKVPAHLCAQRTVTSEPWLPSSSTCPESNFPSSPSNQPLLQTPRRYQQSPPSPAARA